MNRNFIHKYKNMSHNVPFNTLCGTLYPNPKTCQLSFILKWKTTYIFTTFQALTKKSRLLQLAYFLNNGSIKFIHS